MNTIRSLVQSAMDLHDIHRTPSRLEEIAVEAERLLTGLESISRDLDYYDEPLNHAALLRIEADHG